MNGQAQTPQKLACCFNRKKKVGKRGTKDRDPRSKKDKKRRSKCREKNVVVGRFVPPPTSLSFSALMTSALSTQSQFDLPMD